MKVVIKNRHYNTNTAKHICGYFDYSIKAVKELHLNRAGTLFFSILYGTDEEDQITPTNPGDALEFIQQNKHRLKWYPGGYELFNKVINNQYKPDSKDFTEEVD